MLLSTTERTGEGRNGLGFCLVGCFLVCPQTEHPPASGSRAQGLQVCAITPSRELFCCRSQSPQTKLVFDEPRLQLSQVRAKWKPGLEMGSPGGQMPRGSSKAPSGCAGQVEAQGPF